MRKLKFLAIFNLLILFFRPLPSQAAAPVVWVSPGMIRVGPTDVPGTVASINLSGARGETVDTQVIVTGPAGGLTNVNVSASALTGPGGATIAASNVVLYREYYVTVNGTVPGGGGSNPPLGSGTYAEPLIPFNDPQTGAALCSSGAALLACNATVGSGRNQPYWIDISMPRGSGNTPPGAYTGTITVTSAQGNVTVPITLTVWNFELPLKPTELSEWTLWNPNTGNTVDSLAAALMRNKVMSRYDTTSSAASHMANFGMNRDGLDGSFYIGMQCNGSYSSLPTSAQIASAAAAFPAGLPLDQYVADELTGCSAIYAPLKTLAQNLHANGAKSIATFNAVDPNLQDDGNGILPAIDHWVLLTSQQQWPALPYTGKGDLWSYTSCNVGSGNTPEWLIDYPPINERIMAGFLNWQEGATGILYYRADGWTSGNAIGSWNNMPGAGDCGGGTNGPGDGVFVYPPGPIGSSESAPGIRLKAIRDGIQDYEYAQMLKNAGQGSFATSSLQPIAASWTNWTKSPSALEAARAQLGQKLDSLSSPPPAPVITSALTASGTAGSAFSYQITASNNPTGFNATALPAGLSVDTGTGLISGTPTAAGNSSVMISATNAGGTGSATLGLTVNPAADGGANWSGIIDSSRAIDWSKSGASIANRSTICSTLGTTGQAPSFAQSVTAAQINSAIAACPNGQVVFLNAGTYALGGQITIGRSNVTLRGAGPDQTKIVPTAGGGCGNTTSLICASADGNWSGGPDHLTNWTAGYAQGATVVTLASVSGLSVGQVLILDQQDDASDPGSIYICGTLSATCSSEGQAGGGGRGGNHAQMQYALVTAINGNNVTISPGLYMPNWTAAKNPAAWWATTLVQSVGVENLSLDNRTAGAGSITVFNNAYNCWIKNIASIGGGSRSHVDLQYSPNITVRDSYFWGANGANLSYGIEPWMAGNELVENNIFQHVTTPMMIADEAGSVYSYNYVIDQYTTTPSWLYPSSMDHDPGTEMNLVEGNVMASAMQDSIHGSHAMETYFRNRLVGLDTANSQTLQTSSFLLESFSRYANFIGNVLGTSGYHNTYQDNYGGSGGTCDKSIYNLGWGGTECGNGSVNPDPLVISTLMRWGNYDVVNAAAQWNSAEVPSGLSLYANAVPASHALPSSFYLPGKPSFWPSSKPFPGIGPDVTGGNIAGVGGFAYTNPAQDCYTNVMGGSTTSPVGVLTFNAANCYNTTPPPPDTTPPSVPTGLAAVVVSSTQINLSWTASTDNVGVTGYKVFRCQGAGCTPSAQVATTASTSLQDTGLTASTTYVYKVSAFDAAGNVSALSASASAVTLSSSSVSSNLPPVVSAIGTNAVDVDPATPGLQIYDNTSVTYTGSASDPNGGTITWQWSYTTNGGAPVLMASGTGTVQPFTFNYPAGTAPKTYVWILSANNGVSTAQQTLTVSVIARPSNPPPTPPPADPTPGLKKALVYPNPAVKADPTIRAMVGMVNSVEVTIFDASGHVVNSGSVSGAPTGILNGQYYYDYKWTGSKASGMYFAVIHGKAADGTIVRARVKFAVVN